MEKIKIQNKRYAGQKLILPEVGEVQLDNNGVVEVEENIAEALISPEGSLWATVENEEDVEVVDTDEVKAQFEAMTLAELVEYAKEAEIPAADYEKFSKNKKLMVTFLVKRASSL